MNISWNEIKAEDLFELVMIEFLSDSEIAAQFNVSIKAVKEKRKCFKLSTPPEKKYHDMIKSNPKLKDSLDDKAKSELLKKENVDSLAKAITNYAFRSGPIEDFHADGRISQIEMEALNKYMINKLAGLLEVALEVEWFKVYCLWNQSKRFCSNWDASVPDKKDIQACYAMELYGFVEGWEALKR